MSLPPSMTVIEILKSGEPDVLQLATRPLPVIKDHEILVRVNAAGVNGPDLLQRRGQYPPPKGSSDILGLEVSGEVVQTGAAQKTWSVGDKICALTNGGGYAEYVAINSSHCLPIPKGINIIDAACLPETFFTVWSNIFFEKTIHPKSNFLVHGGAGGIGSTAIQLGNAMGLKVYTTVSNSDACKYCKSLGAYKAINVKENDFVEVLRGDGGADIILDIIGGDYIARNIKAARHDARIIQLAFNAGARVEIDLMPIMLKRLNFTGSTLRSRTDTFKSKISADLREYVWPLFENSKKNLRATTYAYFPISKASEAHQLMESPGKQGKIILTI